MGFLSARKITAEEYHEKAKSYEVQITRERNGSDYSVKVFHRRSFRPFAARKCFTRYGAKRWARRRIKQDIHASSFESFDGTDVL